MGNRTAATLLILLLATNLAWFLAHDPAPRAATAPADPEAKDLRRELEQLRAELTRAKKAATEASSPRQRTPPRSRPRPRPAVDQQRIARQQAARKQVEAWKAQILQIEDPGAREVGLQQLEAAIRGEDPILAAAALGAIASLRDAAYNKLRLRAAVRLRLDDTDSQVRRRALWAILQVEPDESDKARVLEVLGKHPDQAGNLIVGAWMAKNRVEGKLAGLYAKALGEGDARARRNTANQLRGMWASAEVEAAMLEAYAADDPHNRGHWDLILGQVRPTRDARVRVIFEMLETSPYSSQSLDRALSKSYLDPAARPLASELALATLQKTPHAGTRRLCLKVLEDHGNASHATRLRAFANNQMVDAALRKRASEVLQRIESRPE